MGFLLISLILSAFQSGLALDNGLALTPPMGWMSWQRFRCNIDCENDPLNCISENLFKSMADQMVLKGFKDVGYEYIIIDDCWLDHQRDENGKLQPDAKRFPSGIKALSDYVHGLGLKFGIYEDYGNLTCGGYPGVLGHLETDANTFAEWGVDYVKLDGCYVDIHQMDQGYPEFGMYLNKTGRPMVYSCSWPAYWENELPDYPSIQKHCNLWRNYGDIQDSWSDVLDIIDHYGDHQDDFAQYAGPGNWNDPDMLIIGDFALSYEQARVQMALWAVLASPLIMSNDLRTIRPEYIEILQNRNVIKINQDALGVQGRRVYQDKPGGVDIYMKPIQPEIESKLSAAVSIMYRNTYGTPAEVSFKPSQIGLDNPGGYYVFEVFDNEPMGAVALDESINVRVNPNGVQLLRLEPVSQKEAEYLQTFAPDSAMNELDFEPALGTEGIEVKTFSKSGWHGEKDEF